LSRTSAKGKFKSGLADSSEKTIKLHTATHLLLAALREVLKDENILQKGSNITSERLRLDFSFSRKLTEEEIKIVEDLVNAKIQQSCEVERQEMSPNEAKKKGALGIFGEKYGEKVSVYKIENFSQEICSGPHVKNTCKLGHFKIIKEESSSAGVRRIKAVLN
jgi:alanyl-tRNA synthetase